MKINLNQVLDYLEEKENCKLITIDNSLFIYDLKEQQHCLHNKDYRLLNELAKQYVNSNYKLFQDELSINLEEVILKVFKIPIDIKKLKKVKSFKKITKKELITVQNGNVKTIKVIRKRNIP